MGREVGRKRQRETDQWAKENGGDNNGKQELSHDVTRADYHAGELCHFLAEKKGD
jgi:hypothetical protein